MVAVCDPVFAAAGAGFTRNAGTWSQEHPALLWEADPVRFAERYPDSGIESSYGDQWPPPCIDYWAYVDPVELVAELSTEGWSHASVVVRLTGDGATDGAALARAFAEILRVGPPGG